MKSFRRRGMGFRVLHAAIGKQVNFSVTSFVERQSQNFKADRAECKYYGTTEIVCSSPRRTKM